MRCLSSKVSSSSSIFIDDEDDHDDDDEEGHLLRGEVARLTWDVAVAWQIPVGRVLYVRVHLSMLFKTIWS